MFLGCPCQACVAELDDAPYGMWPRSKDLPISPRAAVETALDIIFMIWWGWDEDTLDRRAPL